MDSASLQKSSSKLSLDSLAVLGLALTGLLVPILFIPSDLFSFGFTKTALFALGTGVTLIVWILARLKRGSFIFPPFIPTVAVWLIPVAYILSGLFSGVGIGRAFGGVELETDTAGFMIVGATALSLAALLLRRRDDVVKVTRFFGYMLGTILVIQAIVLLLSTGVFGEAVRFSPLGSVVGSTDDFALLAGLGAISSLLALSLLSFQKRTRYTLFTLLGASLLALALYNATTVWIGVGIVALGLFIASIASRRSFAEGDLDGALEVFTEDREQNIASAEGDAAVNTTLSLGVLIASLFFVVGSSTIGAAALGVFDTEQVVVRPSWQATLDIGRAVYDQSPFFGSGPGTFGRDWQLHRSADINQTIFWNTNFGSAIGFVPTSLITTGLFGLLGWLVFFGSILFFGIRSLLRTSKLEKEMQVLSILAFVATVYLWVAAVLFVPGPVLLALAFLVTGVWVATLRFGVSREMGILFARSPRLGFVLVFVFTIILLVTALGMYEVAKRYLGSVAYNSAVSILVDGGDISTANASLVRSLTYAPSDRAYRLQTALGIQEMVNLSQDASLPQEEAQTRFQNTLAGAVEAGLLATRFDEKNSANWIALGNVYQTVVPLQVTGAYDNAKLAYERARELSPMNPELLLVLAQLEIANQNLSGARTYLTDAINLKNDYTAAIFLLSQVEVQEGKTDEALAAAEAAAFFEPQNPVVLFQVGVLRSAKGDTDGAIRAFEQAVFRDPGYANARYFLGASFASKGDLARAIEQFEAISELSSENAEAVREVLVALQGGENPFPQGNSPVADTPSVPLAE